MMFCARTLPARLRTRVPIMLPRPLLMQTVLVSRTVYRNPARPLPLWPQGADTARGSEITLASYMGLSRWLEGPRDQRWSMPGRLPVCAATLHRVLAIGSDAGT